MTSFIVPLLYRFITSDSKFQKQPLTPQIPKLLKMDLGYNERVLLTLWLLMGKSCNVLQQSELS